MSEVLTVNSLPKVLSRTITALPMREEQIPYTKTKLIHYFNW